MTRLATFQACDQVGEAGAGKLAFIGVYNADIVVPQIPFVLPQLFFVVRFRTPINDRPKKVILRVERPGHPPFRMDHTPSVAGVEVDAGPDANFLQLQMIGAFQPFEIKEAGTVKVFIEDEFGDNYAGGLRLRSGVVPSEGQLAFTASLVAAHYKRVMDLQDNERVVIADQLLSDLTSYMKYVGMPPALQFPEGDVRLVLDAKRVHVFFPKPADGEGTIAIEPSELFESSTIERVDKFGFIVSFDRTLRLI